MNDNIEALRAESERLQQDLDAALRANAALDAVIDRCRLDATTAEAKLEEAAKVLEPFVEAAECIDANDDYSSAPIWEHASAMNITIGDLRRARSFLANLKGAE